MGLTLQQYQQILRTSRWLSDDFTKAFLHAIVEAKQEAGVLGIGKEHSLNTDSGLLEMIQYFNYTPPQRVFLEPSDYVRIFSWLEELRMYHNQAGLLKDIVSFNDMFKLNLASCDNGPNAQDDECEDDYF